MSFKFLFGTAMESLTPDEAVSFLECVCTSLRLHADDIKTLHYHFGDEESSFHGQGDDEKYFYTIFAAVTSLHFSSPTLDIVHILRSASSRGVEFFPQLQVLHLRCTGSVSLDAVARLIDAIRARTSDNDAPLSAITLEGHGVSDELTEEVEAQCVQRLKTLVPHVRLAFTRRSFNFNERFLAMHM